jgi:hypothetical protein
MDRGYRQAHRRPGVLGLETFTTRTSEYGPNMRTPATKSSIESAGDSLFLPRLTARIEPGRRAADLCSDLKAGIRARSRDSIDV